MLATTSNARNSSAAVFNPAVMAGAKILIVEDDVVLGDQLKDLLQREGYEVDLCRDGLSGLKLAARDRHQILLLDIMLPHVDGFELLTEVRQYSHMPVIILSAKGAEEERIKGFQKGADDYVSKPCNPQELMLRIDALLRRCQPVTDAKSPQIQSVGDLVLDRAAQQISVADTSMELTPIEFKLLRTLISSSGEVLSKAFLYQTILNRAYSSYDRSLDMHLSRIRRKLYAAGWDGSRLKTVHGKGYVLS